MTVFDIGDSADRVATAKSNPPQPTEFAPGADHVVKVLSSAGDVCAWFGQGADTGELVVVVLPNKWVTIVRPRSGQQIQFAVYTRDLVVGFEGLE